MAVTLSDDIRNYRGVIATASSPYARVDWRTLDSEYNYTSTTDIALKEYAHIIGFDHPEFCYTCEVCHCMKCRLIRGASVSSGATRNYQGAHVPSFTTGYTTTYTAL